MLKYHYERQPKLGITSIITEIDEGHFHQKNDIGHMLAKEQRIIGIVEREGESKFFLLPDRTKNTLKALIFENVSINTKLLCAYGFKFYKDLS